MAGKVAVAEWRGVSRRKSEQAGEGSVDKLVTTVYFTITPEEVVKRPTSCFCGI